MVRLSDLLRKMGCTDDDLQLLRRSDTVEDYVDEQIRRLVKANYQTMRNLKSKVEYEGLGYFCVAYEMLPGAITPRLFEERMEKLYQDEIADLTRRMTDSLTRAGFKSAADFKAKRGSPAIFEECGLSPFEVDYALEECNLI